MPTPNISFATTTNNIANNTASSIEKISGLLFDVSLQPTLFTAGYGLTNKAKVNVNDVIKITSLSEVTDTYGIKKRVEVDAEAEADTNFMYGLPYYHIAEYYRMLGSENGILYVMFADCSSNWDAIETMQRVSGGTINQLGIFTEQALWKLNGAEDKYNLDLITPINLKAMALSEQSQPLQIILSANCSNTSTFATADSTLINLDKVPSCIIGASKVSVVFGQSTAEIVSTMQKRNIIKTPVGIVGAALGSTAFVPVNTSIGYVGGVNLFSTDFQGIELGFGDLTIVDGEFTSKNAYESLSPLRLDTLCDLGYIFPFKIVGENSGIYFVSDATCSKDDFRTIARNRTIHKSRRAVRSALIKYLNAPMLVNPSTGYLASSQITAISNDVKTVLEKMKSDGDISGFVVTISATQNILLDDQLKISYSVTPYGTSKSINVTEGLSTKS